MRRIGRYVLHEEFASGGMASVHLGRVLGDAGFARIVAIKRLHPHVSATPGAVERFMDEANLTARLRHRSIVSTLDVVRDEGELYLVMEYVHGAPLSLLVERARAAAEPIPLAIVSAVVADVLAGLHAAHEATDERGTPLAIVHRDVSPHNVLVATDGTSRVLDFGIAKAAVRLQTTRQDQLKGKLRYMAPEQLLDHEIDARTDAFAAGIVLWEVTTGQRLFDGSSEGAILARVLEGIVLPPSRHRGDVPSALDAVALRALSRDKAGRYPSCAAMAEALRSAVAPAAPAEVGAWLRAQAADVLEARDASLALVAAGADAPVSVRAPRSADGAAVTATIQAALRDDTIVSAPVPELEAAVGPTAPRRRRLAIAGAALLGAGLLVAATWRARAVPTAPAPPTTSASIPAASAAALSRAPSASAPAPSASVVEVASVSRPARAPPRPRAPAAPRAARAGCEQMYTVDKDGIQRVKAECL